MNMKSGYMALNFKSLALGLLLFAISTISNSAIAKPLEFSAAYGSDRAIPLPKTRLAERSVLAIESERQFRKVFGVSSELNINWRKSFLILAFAGPRSSAGYGISVDAVDLNSTESLLDKKLRKNADSSSIVVAVTESTPGPFCFTAAVITYPAALIKVKRERNLKPKRSKRITAAVESYSAVVGSAC